METTATVLVETDPSTAYATVADLGGYPDWSGIVHAVAPAAPTPEGLAVWDVDLRAGVGPFTRSKRLRMIRIVDDSPRRCVFERHELDGRHHSMWRLSCQITEGPDSTTITMDLHYGGRLWTGGVLERILDQEVTEAAQRLRSMLESHPRR